jgi:hypothetical protein
VAELIAELLQQPSVNSCQCGPAARDGWPAAQVGAPITTMLVNNSAMATYEGPDGPV